MFKATKQPTDDAFPSLAVISPKTAELAARLHPIGEERAALFQESIAIAEAKYDAPTVPEKDAIARVAKLLGREPPTFAVSKEERRIQIRSGIRDLDIALGTIRAEMNEEYRRASAVARDQVRPIYEALIGQLAAALIAAYTAQAEIARLTGRLQGEGFSSGDIGNHVPHFLGREVGPNSVVAIALRELVSDGLLAASAIPAELKH
ncbi:hypothetical protein EN781_11225 [Mesorhizobium sp. M4A.F.Ca.ET.090.04.2.1]|uniref:hypothetical protein n=1 Tax=Mesorhizobium sp. M4A.F.Ca.ET.090.04.2.1 TaxID=2496663 RepID=UPI000FCA44A9|nr:hypothetical protein [Mesorhizobium sp. M4A.F.Ca.ET.090.04.2.1]RVC45100.1 hypothetical protein EN781_11225 [Mesorhizobium sp. M4A.F.Ca.ET.090.04.2.1]